MLMKLKIITPLDIFYIEDVSKIAMVGDQVFTDVLGANISKMVSVYVDPIDRKEYWYTSWKRPIEDLILRKVR